MKNNIEYQSPSHQNQVALEVGNSRRQVTSSYPGTLITAQSLRKGFIIKVLSLLMIQLAISATAIGITYIDGSGIKEFMRKNVIIFWIAFGMFVVGFLAFICKSDAFRKVPLNYILMFLVTISASYLLGYLACYTESEIVLFAGIFTVAVVIAVGIYVYFTKTDLSRMGYFISGFAIMIILVLVLCLTFRSRFLNIIYSGLIGLFYTFFLAYDLQKLMGKYETQYTLDQYAIASVELYIDIIQIFLIMVSLRKSSSN